MLESDDHPSTSASIEDDIEQPIEIESLCPIPSCHDNGITKLITINIPFYRQVIVMSFSCEKCGHRNSNLQSGEQAQEFGTEIVLKVKNKEDLNRTVVRSEYGLFEIPELELSIPPKTTSGDLTTIEGVLFSVKEDLEKTQPQRRLINPEMAEKLDSFLQRIDQFLALVMPWTLKLHDPSGNCFIQNPDPLHVDPRCITSHYFRPLEEDKLLGLLDDDAVQQRLTQLTDEELADREWKSYEDVKNEVLRFSGKCNACGANCETRMKPTEIPYFQTVIIISTVCDYCGFKSNEVKSGGAIQPHGCRLAVRVEDSIDLARDLLKSDTCSIRIPELDVELGPGLLCSKFTTVEGLLTSVKEQLERQAPFFIGDSAPENERVIFKEMLVKLESIIQLKQPCTLILDDSAGNSYIQSLAAPLNDGHLQKDFYTRTYEQNEDLGLNDMKVENYEKLQEVKEDDEEMDQ